MTVYVMSETNFWRGRSLNIVGIAATMVAGKEGFDRWHQHPRTDDGKWCEYCKVAWKQDETQAEKRVDHDGAVVEYRVYAVKVME